MCLLWEVLQKHITLLIEHDPFGMKVVEQSISRHYGHESDHPQNQQQPSLKTALPFAKGRYWPQSFPHSLNEHNLVPIRRVREDLFEEEKRVIYPFALGLKVLVAFGNTFEVNEFDSEILLWVGCEMGAVCFVGGHAVYSLPKNIVLYSLHIQVNFYL